MSSNSVCNHTLINKSDSRFTVFRFCRLITRMITDRIGLHSVLLPLLIKPVKNVVIPVFVLRKGKMLFLLGKVTERALFLTVISFRSNGRGLSVC